MNCLKYFLTVILCICTTLLAGQNTIHQTNYFSLGNAYPLVYLENMELDTAIISGNNVVWDFSNSNQTLQLDTLYTLDPSTTIFYNDPQVNYNLSNLCLFEPEGLNIGIDDNMHSYYICDSSSVHFVGNWANNGISEVWYYHLPDTEKYFNFPFSYNDNFVDSFAGTSFDMSGSGWWTFQGTRSVEADGFGTLILPTATYPNCIRIISVRNYDYTFMWGTGNVTRTFYTWFQVNTNGIVLEMETENNIIIQTKYYNSNQVIGLNEVKNKNVVSVNPNPFSADISFSISNRSGRQMSVSIIDLTGKTLYYMDRNYSGFPDNYQLDLSFLSGGVYFLELNIDGARTVKKILKV